MGMSVWREGSMVSVSLAGLTGSGVGAGDVTGDPGVADATGADGATGESFVLAAGVFGVFRVVVIVVGQIGQILHALEFGGGGFEGAFLGVGGPVGEARRDGDDGVDAPAAQVFLEGAFVAGDENEFGERVLFGVGVGDVLARFGVAVGDLLEGLDDLPADLVGGVGQGDADPRVGLVLVGEHQPEDHDEQNREGDRQEQRAPVGEELREVGAVEFAEGRSCGKG